MGNVFSHNKSRDQTDKIVEEAAWPSGLGRWI